MATKAQKTKVGIFLLTSVAIIVGGIFTIQGFRAETTSTYHIRFTESVLGLGSGGLVEYLGVPVGTVQDIYVDENNTARVTIEVIDAKVMLRRGVRARLVLYSLATGTMAISLDGGTGEPLESGSDIPTNASLLDNVSGQLTTVLTDLSGVVVLFRTALEGIGEGEFARLSHNVNQLVVDANEFVVNSNNSFERLEGKFETATDEYTELARDLRALSGDIRTVVKSADDFILMAREKVEPLDLNQSQEDLERVLENVADLSGRLNETIETVNTVANGMLHQTGNMEYSLREGLESITQAFESVQELADSINEDPASLLRGRGTAKERR